MHLSGFSTKSRDGLLCPHVHGTMVVGQEEHLHQSDCDRHQLIPGLYGNGARVEASPNLVSEYPLLPLSKTINQR